jgi:hypothetical protein
MQSSVRLVGNLCHSAARKAISSSDPRVNASLVKARRSSRGGRDVRAKTTAGARGRRNERLYSFSRRQQHHHPPKHRVLVLGPLPDIALIALLDLGLLIAAV